MNTLEELGLLKMDFLGLRTLTVIQNAVKEANKRLPENEKINLDRLDYDDAKTFELIASGKTEGIFQLESEGMKNFMKDLKPQNIEDIIAGISLYRPGPMGSIPDYVRGRHHTDEVKYTTKELEPILKPTYGCIVYQEQVMQIVRDLAGYTLGRSDLVRRAMSKKKLDVMDQERKNFIYGNEEEGIKGCINNGISEAAAKQIFDNMEDFAKYAFNKSHAAAYAIVAYQTAWLKCYYPVEFMAALITSVLSHPGKTAQYIMHLRDMDIELLPPDLNEGLPHFSVNGNKIRFGLAAVKGVGKAVVANMVVERELNGPFESLTDYCIRMDGKDLNKRVIESLIKAGAFDSMGGNRKQYIQGYKTVLDSVLHGKKNTFDGQVDLFGFSEEEETALADHLPDVSEFGEEQLLANEKEVLGIYVSGHPLDKYENYIKRKVSHRSFDFKTVDEADDDGSVANVESTDNLSIFDGQKTIIAGLVHTITRKTTRNNAQMAFVELEDMYGSVEIVVFPKHYERYKQILEEDAKLIIEGRISIQEDQDAKVILDKMYAFEEQKPIVGTPIDTGSKVWIKFKNDDQYVDTYMRVEDVLNSCNEGSHEVLFYIEEGNKRRKFGKRLVVTDRTIQDAEKILGEHSVKIVKKS
jgi:DNA polymerase-3 subunit alpha